MALFWPGIFLFLVICGDGWRILISECFIMFDQPRNRLVTGLGNSTKQMRLLKVPTWDFELSLVVCAGRYSSAAHCKSQFVHCFFLRLLLVFQNCS